MHEQNQNLNKDIEKYKKEPNRNLGDEKYHNSPDNFTRRAQQQSRLSRKKNQ